MQTDYTGGFVCLWRRLNISWMEFSIKPIKPNLLNKRKKPLRKELLSKRNDAAGKNESLDWTEVLIWSFFICYSLLNTRNCKSAGWECRSMQWFLLLRMRWLFQDTQAHHQWEWDQCLDDPQLWEPGGTARCTRECLKVLRGMYYWSALQSLKNPRISNIHLFTIWQSQS